MVKKELLLLLILAILFVVPVLWATRNLELRLDTDYDAHLPVYDYVISYVRSHGAIPSWNPYVGAGISVFGDPVATVFHPFFFLPLVIFGVDGGMRVVWMLVVICAGMTMWWFLRSQGIGPIARVWGTLLYQFSGALVARLAAGHVERFVSFATQSLFFAIALTKKFTKKHMLALSLLAASVLYSGDMYSLWFWLLLFMVIRVSYWFLGIASLREDVPLIVRAGLFFFLFSIPKDIAYVTTVRGHFERFFPIDPYVGSIHWFLAPLAYVVPFAQSFYDRPVLQRLLGFHFNWYEYFVFISPIPFLFLLIERAVWKQAVVKVCVVVLLVAWFYVALAYSYSPFYWLLRAVPQIGIFRVPQRMLMTSLPLVVLITAQAVHMIVAKRHSMRSTMGISLLLVTSVIWVVMISMQIMVRSFEPSRQKEKLFVAVLRSRDPGNFAVANFVCCLQRFFIQQKIPVSSYYYAWRSKETPQYIKAQGTGFDFGVLSREKPTYVISDMESDFSNFGYTAFFDDGVRRAWKTDTPTIIPDIHY